MNRDRINPIKVATLPPRDSKVKRKEEPRSVSSINWPYSNPNHEDIIRKYLAMPEPKLKRKK